MSVVMSAFQNDEGKTAAFVDQELTPPPHVLPGPGADAYDDGAVDAVEFVGSSPSQTGQFLDKYDSLGASGGPSAFGEALPPFVADETPEKTLRRQFRTVGRLQSGRSAGVSRPPRFPRHRTLVDDQAVHEVGPLRCRGQGDHAPEAVPDDSRATSFASTSLQDLHEVGSVRQDVERSDQIT
jgi:hypothetical protein